MASVSHDDLSVEFESFDYKLDDMASKKMLDLCVKFTLQADDIFNQWLAYVTMKRIDTKELTFEIVGAFETWVAQTNKPPTAIHSTPKATKKESRLNSLTPSLSRSDDVDDASIDIASGYTTPQNRDKIVKRMHTTPDDECGSKRLISESGSPHAARPKVELFRGGNTSPSTPFTPSQNYQSRTNRGQLIDSFGCGSTSDWLSRVGPLRSGQSGLPLLVGTLNSEGEVIQNPTADAKFMMQRLSDVAEIMDFSADELLNEMVSKHEEVEALEHVGVVHHGAVHVGGRICCDGIGRLNAKSLLLEGTMEESRGSIMGLDVSGLSRYSFFPGQVVLMQGMNPSGKSFMASSMFSSQPPDPVPLPDLKEDLTVFVAAGPFTTSDSDAYEPLQDFLALVKETRPQVCIFLGPFMDAKNDLVINNNCQAGDVTYEDLFQKVLHLIQSAMTELGGACQAVLIPSSRDVHHTFVYPQPPLVIQGSKEPKHMKSFWDPSLLSIGGLLVGTTSTDILFHLGAEEISFPPGSSDRLARLCGHILTQRSFYPLNPPSEEVNMDYSLYEQHGLLHKIPHLMIMPSELKQFTKEVSGCLCLNPGRLAKGKMAGSYCRINIKAKAAGTSVKDSIISQILRI